MPAPVNGTDRFIGIASGNQHSCAVDTAGTGLCWGARNLLGDGGLDRPSPGPIAGGYRLTTISAGTSSSCAVTDTQAAICWGYGQAGQLGDGVAQDPGGPELVAETPVTVTGGYSFAAVSVGNSHACGRTTTDVAICWGGNFAGGLGDGTIVSRPSPAIVPGSWTDLTTGYDFSCGLDPAGTAFCWGANQEGQLGIGVSAVFEVPARVY